MINNWVIVAPKNRNQCFRILLIGLLATLLATVTGCSDKITASNVEATEEWGALVDGTKADTAINDERIVDINQTRSVGNFKPGTVSNEEIAAFTNRRPVKLLESVGWTSQPKDRIDIPFSPEISVPVTVWIVGGPFDTQRDLAIDHCVTTTSIWQDERMGLRFSNFEIVDATGNANAANYLNFDCSMRAGIQNDIGQRNGRINVYWVDNVDGGTDRGQACVIGSDFVAMGRSANDELLVHELGHNLDLRHVDGQATFDNTNIMDSSSSTRAFITEGQLFRAHLNVNSAINDLYNARAGEPLRTCGHSSSSNDCPILNTRLWADGLFPSN